MKSSTKSVLFVITKSNFGGAQRYVFDLATHLPKEYVPTVALGGTGAQGAEPGSLKTKLEKANIRTIIIPHFMRDMSLIDDVCAFFELLTTLKTEKPDILHVTSSKAGGLGALAGRLCGIRRIIFTSHGLTFDESWRPRWQRALIYLGTWCTILLSTYTIQISSDTYARARRMPLVGKKVRLVYNGIDAPCFLARDVARKTLLPDATDIVYESPWLGTLAEYHPNKNLLVLVDTIALLNTQGIQAHLLLVGEGEERDMLAVRARTHGIAHLVHLVGYVPEGARYLSALDIFLLPSRKEGLPYVLMEAGYASLPCVVSDIHGNTDIVTDGVSGIVTLPTATHFKDACTDLLHDQARSSHYGKTLHEHVVTRFSIHMMVRGTIALYTHHDGASSPTPSISLSKSS